MSEPTDTAPDVIPLPGTELRDPRVSPEQGDAFACSRWQRRFDCWTDSRGVLLTSRRTIDTTHVKYRTPRGFGRMPVDKWMAWAATTDVKPHATTRRVRSRWGCVHRDRDQTTEHVVFEWGTVTRFLQQRDRWFRCKVQFEVFGVVRESWLPAGVHLEQLGWAFHAGLMTTFRMDPDGLGMMRAEAEKRLSNVVDFRRGG